MCWRILRSFFVALIVCVAYGSVVHAASLESVAARLTRQAVSTSTNIELAFTTPTGVNGNSASIVVDFPSAFNIGAIVAGDMSLSYGPTTGSENPLTVGAFAAGGVWGLQRSGRSLFLIPPTDAGIGAIPAGSRVIFRLGTWVTGGVHQAINPSSSGIYTIQVRGNFGDTGEGFVQIRSSDDLTVTATIVASEGDGEDGEGGGAGGGGTPPVFGGGGLGGAPLEFDGAAPTISDLRVTERTDTSALISWTTDEAADAFLEYGTAAGAYTLGMRTRAERGVSHQFRIDGLTPETTYHVHVRARDAVLNTRWSGDLVFTTLSVPTGLTISGIEVTYVDDHQAILHWLTSSDAIGGVRLITPLGERVIPGSLAARSHTLTIEGLSPDTTYPFSITAQPVPSGEVVSAIGGGFRTLSDRTPPANVLNFRGVYSASPSRVDLSWVNPTDADFSNVTVTRLPSSVLEAETVVCTSPTTSCTDFSLGAATLLTYRAVARDATGNRSSGAIAVVVVSPTLTPSPEPILTPTPVVPERTPSTEEVSASDPARAEGGAMEGHVLPPILRPIESGATSTESVVTGESSSTVSLPSTSEESLATSTTEAGAGTEAALVLVPAFYLSDLVPATPDRVGIRSALVGRSVQVRLPVIGSTSSLSQAQIRVSGGSVYQLAYRDALAAYATDFVFDAAQGQEQSVFIQVVAADGRRWEESFAFHVWQGARVLDVSERSRSTAVAGASIEIRTDAGGIVERLTTDASGRYAEVLPNGLYRLRVMKEGFRLSEREVRVESGVLVQDIELQRTVRSLSEILDPQATLGQNVVALGAEAVLAAQIGLEVIRQPAVQAATQNVVAPAVVIATVGTTATAVTGFNLLNYLRFFFTQPLLLIRRRKRKAWGVVYNALSKQPVELAIVRLLKAGTQFAIQTRITDAQGRFSFFVPAGAYTIQVQKPGYTYPTTYLKSEQVDVDYTDLYHGEALKVTETTTISPNIPLDPVQKEETPKSILLKRRLRTLQSAVSVLGILASLGAIVISPTPLMFGFVGFQLVSYALFRRLAIPPAPKRWGIVYDTDGKQPLAKAVIRIFDKRFNKLLETQITTKDGTYGFFVTKGLYYFTAEKPGYERYLSADLDLTAAKDTYIDRRFSLKRVGAQE